MSTEELAKHKFLFPLPLRSCASFMKKSYHSSLNVKGTTAYPPSRPHPEKYKTEEERHWLEMNV